MGQWIKRAAIVNSELAGFSLNHIKEIFVVLEILTENHMLLRPGRTGMLALFQLYVYIVDYDWTVWLVLGKIEAATVYCRVFPLSLCALVSLYYISWLKLRLVGKHPLCVPKQHRSKGIVYRSDSSPKFLWALLEATFFTNDSNFVIFYRGRPNLLFPNHLTGLSSW